MPRRAATVVGMSRATDAVGAYGERVAVRALSQTGMRVIERNWRCARGEIDIVAMDGDTLVFCEVKTRRGDRFPPAEAVDRAKVRRLRSLAAAWLDQHPQVRGEVRFDVLSVVARVSGPAAVEHVRGAF